MKDISINFILHNRFNYFKASVRELYNISEELKSNIKINLLVTDYDESFKLIVNDIKQNELEVHVYQVRGENNYLNKIQTALQNSNKYAISIDEDIYISKNTWEYFLSSLNILNDSNILFVSPIITTGIPSVDLFANQFLTEEERKNLYKIYNSTHIPTIWGADYSKLNQHTINAEKWDCELFYKEVDSIDHHYRGVHPVRFSHEAQNYLNDICIRDLNRIHSISDFSIEVVSRPYFCNSVFGIRVDTWSKIINDKSLYRDEFDEVPLNLYMKNNKLKMAFINNGFAVHPSYNTINIFGYNYSNLSDKFFNCEYFK